MDIASFLREVDVFHHVDRDAAERLAARTGDERFPAGTTIVRRGEAGDCMYVIVEGQALVPIFDQEGREQFVAQLGPKQIFGEMALLTGEARSADVIAATDCRCLVLRRDAVDELISKNNEAAQLLTAILGERLVRSGIIRQIGKYRLTGEIGRGGMSIVYGGVHPGLDRVVAIKMLSHRLVYRPGFRERFENEARIISKLRHPHIVDVYDTESAFATFFIVMERLQGFSLEAMIEARGFLSPDRARGILRQLCSALQAAHRQGIVHRDLKPSNIMVASDGNLKLMDFGLALNVGLADESLRTSAMSGTPLYMAPEQVRGETIDARTDIYALGILAYEMLTGQPPFQGKFYQVMEAHQSTPVPSPRERAKEVPDDLEELVLKATAKSPDDRFQSCEEILSFLSAPEPISSLAVETVTFAYDPAQREAVKKLVEEMRDRGGDIPGVRVF